MIGSIIGGILGYGAAKDAAAAQAKAQAEMMARLNGISIPEAQKLVVEQLVSQGNLTPEVIEAFNLPPSEVAKIQEDTSVRQNQVQALDMIKQRAQGGLTASDRASYNQIRNAVARDEEAKQAQLMQSMQARGMGGSGAEFAAALANSQNGAENASEQGDQLAAAASRNALEAAAQMAAQSGQLRSQDFNVANTKASAQDEYNRFNTQNQQNVSASNVGNRNSAQQYNLTNNQNLANQNVANRRAEDTRYEQAKQQKFDNEFKKATGQNNISAMQGQTAANLAGAKGAMFNGIGNALDQGIGAFAGGMTGGMGGAGVANGINPEWGMDRAGGTTSMSQDYLNMAHGGEVPGIAQVKGDSPINDTHHAKLSPGEIVLPRSVTESDNPAKEAAKFVKDLKKRASLDVNNFLTKLSLNRK